MSRNLAIAIFAGVTVTALLFAAAGPLMSNVEQPDYKVERSDGAMELRAYPTMVSAATVVKGDRKAAIQAGFRMLAAYIFGANEGSKKVEMTAPVMQERASRGMPPADISEETPGNWTVRFIMPRAWSLATLPKPKNDRVALEETAASTFAVISFSGLARDAALKAKTAELSAFIAHNKLQPKGQPIFAFYNPPWTLPFFRRNEVMIKVEPRGSK